MRNIRYDEAAFEKRLTLNELNLRLSGKQKAV